LNASIRRSPEAPITSALWRHIALEAHRGKIFKIAARKYELGLVETGKTGEFIWVRLDDVASYLDGEPFDEDLNASNDE
jgi:hypothetical protein